MTFINDSEYARQLPATLPHLHKMPPGLILPWFQNERDRIVALIAPEEGKSAATILGVSLTQVRRYVRSVEKPSARKLEQGDDPFGIFMPDFEAALTDALEKTQEPPTEFDKQRLQAVIPKALWEPKPWKPAGEPFSRSSQFPNSEVKLLRKRMKEKLQKVRQRVIWDNSTRRYVAEYTTFEQLNDEFQKARNARRCWDEVCFELEEKYNR